MGNTLVSYTAEGGIATITLTDPPSNAVTHEMMKDLDEAILEARFDNDVHLVVVTGHGDWFSGGVDTQMLPEIDSAYSYYFGLHASETLTRIENTPKVVIAALNGPAIGIGFEIALACDMRIARKASGAIRLPEVSLGLLPLCGGTHRAARLAGASRALRLVIDATPIEYDEAARIGLVDFVWEADSTEAFVRTVLEHARRYVPPHGASRAVGLAKQSIRHGSARAAAVDDALDRAFHSSLFGSEDAREGIRALLEARTPVFQGK
jgi:enoyl-CoA hydratase